MTSRALSKRRSFIIILIIVVGIFAWSPWVTDEFATSLVVQSLGGPDQEYNYLGDLLPLRDVPKTVIRVPFGALVYFPSEAMFTVTFWGLVL
jgi:hypothetical protein